MPRVNQHPFWTAVVVAWVVTTALLSQHEGVVPERADRAAGVDFVRDVRPILAENCYECHGPDDAARQGDLRLDRAPASLPGREGGPVVVPGRPDQSLLIERVASADADLRMPAGGEPLAPEQIAILREWIAEGASWPEHWAFTKPVRPEVPAVGAGGWPRSEVDRFVLRALEERGWSPSPEATREAWLRRVTFDLTGLPPTAEEIEAFLADSREGAREAVVDRLLASSRFGERQAQDWLDAARYADTNGYLYDQERPTWKWREWVVGAFNRNLPYDRFAIEQLAGDLLPEATVSQQVATGFNRNHLINSEGGEDDDEYRCAYVVDRVNTTATTFLGLTLGCAQCHDHKFDPLTQRDYYRFYAFFDNVDENGRDSALRPTLSVPDPDQEPRIADLDSRIEALERRLEGEDAAMEAGQRDWEERTRQRLDPPVSWRVVQPIGMMAHRGSVLTQLEDGSVLARGDAPVRDTFDLVFKPGAQTVTAVRLEVLPDGPDGAIGRGKDGVFILTGLTLRVSTVSDAEDPPPVYVASAEADLSQAPPENPAQFEVLPGSVASCIVVSDDEERGPGGFRGFRSGWTIVGDECRRSHEAVLLPAEPLSLNDVSILSVKLEHEGKPYRTQIARFRISISSDQRIRDLLLPVAAKAWHAVGPFPAKDAGSAFGTAFEPEEEIAAGIDLGRTYRTPAAAREERGEPRAESAPAPEGDVAAASRPGRDPDLRWKEKRWFDGRRSTLETTGNGVWYLARELTSTAPRTATLNVEGADGVKIWMNGKQVFARAPGGREADGRSRGSRGGDEVPVSLREGRNDLVMKLVHRDRSARGNDGDEPDAGGFGSAFGRGRGIPFEFSMTPEGDDVLSLEVTCAVDAGATRSDRQRKVIRDFYREKIDPVGRTLFAAVDELRREAARLRRAMPTALVMKERAEPRETRVFVRGDFRNKGAVVTAGVPDVLPPMAADLPRNRLGLARWLASGDNPLTARVFVNRVWQQYFGEGLVSTPDDFGIRGDTPVHRDLLDWLSVRFVETGWDVKALHKLIVLSATYGQASSASPEVRDRDPANRWFTRGPRQRLSAEMVRDQALFVSGLLVERVGGPSVRPFQPEGLLREVGGGRRDYRRDRGEDQYRRGLYVFWKREIPYPSMIIFDAAKRETCSVRRALTTTPLQALVLLNDPVYVEAARMLGQRMLKDGGATDDARIAWGFRSCTSRLPSPGEARLLATLLSEERRGFAADPDAARKFLGVGDAKVDSAVDPAESAAWASVGSALLNLDETIHR